MNDMPTAKWEHVTPAIARHMLDAAGPNRKVRGTIVSRYAGDMEAGKWLITHQALAFGVDGMLLDGQHRLHAVIASNKTVLILVVRGIPKKSCAVVDCGFMRSTVDVAGFAGLEGVTSRMCGMAVAMREGCRCAPDKTCSRTQLLEYLQVHLPVIQSTLRMLPKRPQVSVACVAAVFARAHYHVSSTGNPLHRAAYLLVNGEPPDDQLADGDKAMLTLHRWLIASHAKLAGRGGRVETYGKSQRALYAYLHDERIVVLRRSKDMAELFPMETDSTSE